MNSTPGHLKEMSTQTPYGEVHSTVEYVGCYTVAQKLSPAEKKENERMRRVVAQARRSANEHDKKLADGIPIVRKSIGVGHCTSVGLFVRETESFIFYADRCFDAKEIETATVKKLKKNGVKRPHLEACIGCRDHSSHTD